MTTATLAQMHEDHQRWQAEHALWHDQLAEWQHEVFRAVGDLAKLEKALREHERKLEVHAAAIRLYNQEANRHEHELVEKARVGATANQPCGCGTHAAEAYDHARQRETHEALKREHHGLMARWALLLKALEIPTP